MLFYNARAESISTPQHGGIDELQMLEHPDTADPEPKDLAAQLEPQDVEERKSQQDEAVQSTNESSGTLLNDGNNVFSEYTVGPDGSKLELDTHSGDINEQSIQELRKPSESSRRASINERMITDHMTANYTIIDHTYHSYQV